MLSSLHIENIAIMDNVSLDFQQGFCVLTGETGAGKSIIIDSINLLTGERSSKELVRSGTDKAIVEGVVYTQNQEIFNILNENGIAFEEDEPLILCREINKDGRSLVRINGRVSTTGILKSICSRMINIHGQNDNQAILDIGFHGDFLDSYANLQSEINDYKEVYLKVKDIKEKLNQQDTDIRLKEQKKEILLYQINEIDNAKLKAGEDEEIDTLRHKYLNNEKIVISVNEGYFALNGNEDMTGAYELIENAKSAMEVLSNYEPNAKELSAKLEDIIYNLDEILDAIREIKDNEDFEGVDIDFIESRIDTLNSLKRKYKGTIEEILEQRNKFQEEFDQIEQSDEYKNYLNKQLNLLIEELENKAQVISQKRKSAGEELSKAIAKELKDLDMDKVEFFVSVEECDFNSKGKDKVEFLISTNVGEPLKPLNKIASGGELSRIILSLKVVLAASDSISTMIFDEVDTGVSGKAAQKIAEKLKKLSKNKQVFVITHLAQIAAFADYHYLIEKKTDNQKTVSAVSNLDYNGRIQELARIISGTVVTENAVKTAKEMIELNGKS